MAKPVGHTRDETASRRSNDWFWRCRWYFHSDSVRRCHYWCFVRRFKPPPLARTNPDTSGHRGRDGGFSLCVYPRAFDVSLNVVRNDR